MSHRLPLRPHSIPTPVFVKALPFLAIAAFLFGSIFVYIGYQSAAGGAPGWGFGIGLFGLLGVALAIFLWRMGARLGAELRRDRDTR
jgi:hypothetical protein